MPVKNSMAFVFIQLISESKKFDIFSGIPDKVLLMLSNTLPTLIIQLARALIGNVKISMKRSLIDNICFVTSI